MLHRHDMPGSHNVSSLKNEMGRACLSQRLGRHDPQRAQRGCGASNRSDQDVILPPRKSVTRSGECVE